MNRRSQTHSLVQRRLLVETRSDTMQFSMEKDERNSRHLALPSHCAVKETIVVMQAVKFGLEPRGEVISQFIESVRVFS